MWAGRQSWSGETRMRRVDERAGRAFETGGLCCTARGSVCVRIGRGADGAADEC